MLGPSGRIGDIKRLMERLLPIVGDISELMDRLVPNVVDIRKLMDRLVPNVGGHKEAHRKASLL